MVSPWSWCRPYSWPLSSSLVSGEVVGPVAPPAVLRARAVGYPGRPGPLPCCSCASPCVSPASCPCVLPGRRALSLAVRCSGCGLRSFAQWPVGWRALWLCCPSCGRCSSLGPRSLPASVAQLVLPFSSRRLAA